MVKVFNILAGDTKDSHLAFISGIARKGTICKSCNTIDECSVILVFCPVASRAGTDINEALQKIPDDQADKMIILVVMHHTMDPNRHVPVISELDTGIKEVALTVDCLFHENQGLLRCPRNEKAIACVQKKLKETQGTCCCCCC